MPSFDRGFKIVARAAGRQLAGLAHVVCTTWRPIVSEVQAVERLADRAFRAARGRERFVVYMEAYTYWEEGVPWSVLAKSGLLSERERLPVVSLVFYLRPDGYRPLGGAAPSGWRRWVSRRSRCGRARCAYGRRCRRRRGRTCRG